MKPKRSVLLNMDLTGIRAESAVVLIMHPHANPIFDHQALIRWGSVVKREALTEKGAIAPISALTILKATDVEKVMSAALDTGGLNPVLTLESRNVATE